MSDRPKVPTPQAKAQAKVKAAEADLEVAQAERIEDAEKRKSLEKQLAEMKDELQRQMDLH